MADDLPRVTEILKRAGVCGDFDRVPQSALDRGHAVHEAAALDDLGTLDEASVDDRLRGYLAAWRAFRRETGAECIEIERKVRREDLGYRGTLDRVAVIGGKRWIIDLKCGASCQPWHALQTAAYAMAYSPDLAMQRGCVHIESSGAYRLRVHRDPGDEATWLRALRAVKGGGV